MKQYMPMKPVKRGIKVWVRADAVTGYICDFEIYVGKASDNSQSAAEVLQLTECLRGKNYHIYADNYFTTTRLLGTLRTHGLYGCGTTRSTRRGFPETLKSVSLERGEHAFCQRGDLVASVWMDKKSVTMLSGRRHTHCTEKAEGWHEGLCAVP